MLPALFALLIAAETPSQPAAAHEGHSEEATSKVEKKVCRTDDSNTGSRMRKKQCLTQSEWARKDQGKSAADLKTIGGR